MEAPKIVEHIVRVTMNGDEAKAEFVGTLVRCEHCTHWTRDRGGKDQPYGYCSIGGKSVTKYEYDYCSSVERREDVKETN